MVEATRLLFVAGYVALDMLPYLLLTLHVFRGNLRCGRRTLVVAVLAMMAAELPVGLFRTMTVDNLALFLCSVLMTCIWGIPLLALIRSSWDRIVFTVMVLVNLSGFVSSMSMFLADRLSMALMRQSMVTGGRLIVPMPVMIVRPVISQSIVLLVMLVMCMLVCIPLRIWAVPVYTELVGSQGSDDIWRYLWLVPVTFALLGIRLRYGDGMPEYDAMRQANNALFLLGFNIGAMLVYVLVVRLVREHDRNVELQAKNRWLALQSQAFEHFREQEEQQRRIRHDFRHQLAVISVLAEQGDTAELREYVGKTVQRIDNAGFRRLAANPELDALLQYYRHETERRGAGFCAKINLPEPLGLDLPDMTMILGNLLDNASYAAGQVAQRQERQDDEVHQSQHEPDDAESARHCVKLDMGVKGGCCIIVVRNPYVGPLRRSYGELASTKHEGPAIGLKSVRQSTARLGGTCEISYTDSCFRVQVVLPLGNTGKQACNNSDGASSHAFHHRCLVHRDQSCGSSDIV